MSAFLKSLVIPLFLGFTHFVGAQWNHQTIFTQHLNINCIENDPTNTFCVAGSFNLFKNTGNPSVWTNITNNTTNYFQHNSLIVYDNNHILSVGRLYNPSNGGIMITYNGGANWTTIDLGVVGFELTDVARNGTTLVAVGTWGKIYQSTNDGATWTNIPSGTTTDLHTVCYNPVSNEWTIGGLNKKLTSFNNGLTFSSATVTGEIFDINFENGFLIETTKIGYTGALGYHSTIVKKTGTGTTLNSYVVPFAANTTTFLPDGNLITAGNQFAVLSSSSNSILVSRDSIHNLSNTSPETVNEMVFLNSVAYAVGPDGALGYRNLPFTSTYYVPATFQLSQQDGCAGEAFSAIAINSNSDSYKWYFDSNLVGTDDTLNYSFSSTPGNHTVSLVTSYQGVKDSISKNSFTNYNTYIPVTFNLNFPDTVCYGTAANGTFHNTSPYTVDLIRVRTTSNVLYYLTTPISQNAVYNIYIPNLTASDTLFIEYTQHNACDTLVSVYTYPVLVQPTMANAFSVITSQPTYCFPYDSIQFQLVSNQAGITYSLVNNNYIPGSLYPTTSTISPSTISTVGASTFQLPNNNMFYRDYGMNVYNNSYGVNFQYTHPEYINKIAVEISYSGCPSQTFELISFTVQNPHAMFHSSFGTQINDTAEIVNDQVNASQIWSNTVTNGFSNQLTGVNPIIGSYQSGEEQITLINQSNYGCSDTITQTHTFLDPVSADTSIVYCFSDEFKHMTVTGSMIDQDDNLIEYGYNDAPFGFNSTAMIRKISPNGTLLWQKSFSNSSSSTSINRFTAGAMDSLGNYYFAKTTAIQTNIDVFNKYGMYISSLPTQVNGINTQVSQILIKGSKLIYTNRLGIHVYGIGFSQTITFTPIQNFQTIVPEIAGNQFFLQQVDDDSYVYMAQITYSGSYSTQIGNFYSPPSSGSALIGAKLSLSQGFSDEKVLAYTSFSGIPFIRSFALDGQNNCYFLVKEFTYFNQDYQLLDSTITLDDGPFSSFLVKTDDQFNLLSLTATNLRSGKIEPWKNDQFILSGIGYDGLKLKRTGNYQCLKNTVSSGEYALTIATVDTDCKLVNGINFRMADGLTPFVEANNTTIYLSVKNHDPNYGFADSIVLPFNGEVIHFDSSFVLKLSTNNCLPIQDTFNLCNTNSSFHLNYFSQDDSVAYIMNNGGTITSGYFPVENNFIIGTAPNPTSGFDITFYNLENELIDSFVYVEVQAVYPLLDSLYTADCSNGISFYFNDPDIMSYEWNFNGSITNYYSFSVSNSDLPLNNPVTAFLTTEDKNNCIVTQDFEMLKLFDPILPNLPETLDLLCNYPLQMYLDSNSFENVQWTFLGNTYNGNILYIPGNAITTTYHFTMYVSGQDINGCTFNESILVDACSNLALSENNIRMSVYPNPAKDYLTVQFEHSCDLVNLQLSDINGKVLLIQKAENTNSVLVPVGQLSSGYYLLSGSLPDGKSFSPIRIIKE
ncbi:hypothetical protein D3C71_579750 [compost metagenome]